MLIRSKLYLALALSIVLIGTAILVLLLAYQDVKMVASEQSVSNEVIKGVFELNVLTSDYILHQNERSYEQWQAKYTNLGKLLEEFIVEENGDVKDVKEMIEQNYFKLKQNFIEIAGIYEQKNIKNIELEILENKFSDHVEKLNLDDNLVEEHEEILKAIEKYKTQNDIRNNLEERLVGSISIDSQNIVSYAFSLHNLLFDKLQALQFKIYIIGFLTILLLFTVIILLSILFYNNVIHPITHLSVGAKEIAKGNYGFKLTVDNKSNDEIDQLSNAFNEMSEAIKQDQIKLKQQAEIVKNKQQELEEQKEAILNVLDDAEEEKSKSEILARDLEKFKLAVEGVSDEIIITDMKEVILYANPAAEKVTGYRLSEMLGHKPFELWGKKWDKNLLKRMTDIHQTKDGHFHEQIVSVRKDGTDYACDLFIAPILDERGQVIFFVRVARDITREKEVDKAKTEFVSLASHQLRTPLTAINWYSEMLLDKDNKSKLSGDQKKYLGKIYHSNQRMTQLVNSLLNVSRIEMGTFAVEPKKVNLLQIADSVINEQMHNFDIKQIKFEKEYGRGIPKKMKLDEQLVRIIIQNLLSNAVKYTPEKGKVSLVIEKDEENIRIIVSDTGYGIPKEAQPQIFTKLYRADNVKVKDTDGTGLGLYLVKSILDHVGGKVWFKSEENKGTVFYATFPLKGMKAKKGDKKLEKNI